jgi:hypothetical protein
MLSLPRRRRDRCCHRGAQIGELQWEYVDGTIGWKLTSPVSTIRAVVRPVS